MVSKIGFMFFKIKISHDNQKIKNMVFLKNIFKKYF